MSRSPRWFALVLLVMISACDETSSPPADANSYQRDFFSIKSAIESTHPGMAKEPLPFPAFAATPGSLFDGTYGELAHTQSVSEFYFVVSRFLATLGDGHASLSWYQDGDASGLPVEFAVLDDDLYVITSYDSASASLVNRRVLAINGTPARQLIETADGYVTADAGHKGWKRRLSSGSPRLLRDADFLRYIGVCGGESDVRVTVARADGEGDDAVLPLVRTTRLSLRDLTNLTRNDTTQVSRSNLYRMLPELSTLYMQLNTLPATVDQVFLQEAFEAAQLSGARHFVLDLRSNGGGNSDWYSAFLSHVVSEPRDIRVFRGWRRNGAANEALGTGVDHLEPKSAGRGFGGKLYLLTGAHTMSSATFFVVAVQDNRLGLVLGEACGNNSTRYGYVETRTLENTGLTFSSSIRIWERIGVSRENWHMPITPDIGIPTRIEHYERHADPVWDYLVAVLLR